MTDMLNNIIGRHGLKYIILLLFCLNLFMPPVFGMNVADIETLFKTGMPEGVIYTPVPRGLIISVNDNLFFDDCDFRIKENSLHILDTVANLLKTISNYCVIEHHSQKNLCTDSFQGWELSSMRSSNIAEYLVKCNKVPPEKIFDIGFGETMPFKENVNSVGKSMDNRVDFVLIEYEAMR